MSRHKLLQLVIAVLWTFHHIQTQRCHLALQLKIDMDEEYSDGNATWGERVRGSKNLKRRRIAAWVEDYLGRNAIYAPLMFRRRFSFQRLCTTSCVKPLSPPALVFRSNDIVGLVSLGTRLTCEFFVPCVSFV